MSAVAELRRLRYLAALGVTPLVSRAPLPGAAPSRKLALRERLSLCGELCGEPCAAPRGARREASRPQLHRESQEKPQQLQESRQSPAPRDAAPPSPRVLRDAALAAARPAPGGQGETADPRAARFRLAVIVCARRLWLEDLGDEALATEQLQLVVAIARALEHGAGEAAEPAVTQFDWPLHDNRQLDLGADEAAAALSSFLGRRLHERACVELMCLGQAAAERVAPLALSCPVRHLPATKALLRDPLRKRELWHELRA